MNAGHPGCWTVMPADRNLSAERRRILNALRLERGLPEAQDESLPTFSSVERRTDAFRLVVWKEESAAQEFAAELTRRTDCEWKVIPTHCDEP